MDFENVQSLRGCVVSTKTLKEVGEGCDFCKVVSALGT